MPRGAIRTRVAALERRRERVVPIEPIQRALGGERHDAAERVAAPQRRHRPARNLGAAQAVDVHQVSARAQERAEGELVRHAHAVDQRQHAVAADAADAETGQTEAAARAGNADARFEAHQVGDVAHQFLFDLLGGRHRDGCRHRIERLRGARGDHGDGFVRRFAVFLRRGGKGGTGQQKRGEAGEERNARGGERAVGVAQRAPSGERRGDFGLRQQAGRPGSRSHVRQVPSGM